MFRLMIHKGVRASAARVFFTPFRKRSNLTVKVNALVDGFCLRVKGNRCALLHQRSVDKYRCG